MKKRLIIGLTLAMAITVSGCTTKLLKNTSDNKPPVSPETQTPVKDTGNNKPSVSSETQTDSNQKTFTLEELKKYDGQNGKKAYVAVEGKVYDVTNAQGWKNGKHKQGITAGKDLSKEIAGAEHGKDVLKEVPVVGILK